MRTARPVDAPFACGHRYAGRHTPGAKAHFVLSEVAWAKAQAYLEVRSGECSGGYISSGLSSMVRICRQRGRSNMQSIFAIEATAASMGEVRQGSVVTTNGRRCLGYPGRCRMESMLAPTLASAPE